MQDRPNFFIVGAPKCGTTSLHGCLKEHPQVFFSKIKEPDFFAELRPSRNVDNLQAYLALFEGSGSQPNVRAIGEASTTYLHTPGALEKLREFAPDAKIVVVVRTPIDMVQSLHSHMLFFQSESVEDFEEAWKLSEDRLQGRNLPQVKKVIFPLQLAYREMGKLGKYVSHAYEVFPAEQIYVVVFDDFRADPAGVYRGLEKFLGLDDDGRTEFEHKNVSRTHGKRSFLSKLITGIPQPITKALRNMGLGNTGLGDKLVSKVAEKQVRIELKPELKQELVDFYRDDVALLGRVLGRDLSHWLG